MSVVSIAMKRARLAGYFRRLAEVAGLPRDQYLPHHRKHVPDAPSRSL